MKSAFLQSQINTVGLVGHWKLWDGTAFDYSLNGSLGILQENAAYAFPGVKFNGSTDWIEVPDLDFFDFSNKMSVLAWAYVTTLSYPINDWAKIISKPHTALELPWEMFAMGLYERTLSPYFIITDGINGGDRIEVYDTDFIIALNSWNLFTGTYDGETVTLSINGELVTQESTNITMGQNDVSLAIGAGIEAANKFPGRIDDVMLFDKALSVAEIKSIYETTRGRYSV